jgi:hypothetical protein
VSQFDAILNDLIAERGVCAVCAVPGVMDLVREDWNNDILDQWAKGQEE